MTTHYVGRARTMRSIQFAAGGEVLVLAGGCHPAQLWRWREGELLGQLQVDPASVATSCAVSPDGELVALGDVAGNVGVWKADSGQPIGDPLCVPGPASHLAFDPAARRLAVGTGRSTALIVSLPGLEPLREIVHCTAPIFGDYQVGWVAFSPDGEMLLTSSSGFWEICAWELAGGKKLWSYDYGGGNPSTVAASFAPDGSHVTLACRGVVLERATGRERHVLDPDGRSGRWVRTGAGVAWIERGGRLRALRTDDGRPLCELSPSGS